VVHDDVRQHVFWVPRLHDPALFAGDWIADYYESQAPAGYRAVYWLLTLPVNAIQASKLLPLGLTVILSLAMFWLGTSLWRRVDAAALGSVLLVWSVWQYDDVASATPRAYALPLLVIQLAALAAGRRWVALLVLPVEALFYPLGCPLPVVTLGLWALWRAADQEGLTPRGRNGSGRNGSGRNELRPYGIGHVGARFIAPPGRERLLRVLRRALPDLLQLGAVTLVALALVGLGQIDAARFGPTVTAAQARTMPEFQPGGRASYFGGSWYQFWFESSRSGFALSPKDPSLEDTPLQNMPVIAIPFSLAVLFAGWMLAGRLGWTRPPPVPRSAMLLVVLLAASLLLFAAAHVLLFLLYLPARYVQFSLPVVWALAGCLVWVLVGVRIATRRGRSVRAQRLRPLGGRAGLTGAELATLAGIALLTLHPPPPGDFYVVGRYPAIYGYLRSTTPDTLVAALPADSNILPLFGQRPILTSYEHALPYQLGYYLPLRERTEAFRSAYFAPTLEPLATVISEDGVGLVIANPDALERRRRADRDHPPALEKILDRCGVLRERDLVVLTAACIQDAASGQRR
jgi:hypothetical protein